MTSDDTALLVLPGIGLGREAWSPTLQHVGGPARVIAWPMPGYGLAPAGRPLEVDALARQLIDAVPSDVRRVVVAAHSASCQVAAHAAALDPGRVAGVVLVGPTTDPRASSWPRLAARWLATARHEDPRQVPSLVRQYARTTLVGMARALDAARRDDLCRTLAGAQARVLVVRGRHDHICPADWAAQVAESGLEGAVVNLPFGAHMIPLTHGRPVAAAIDAFVETTLAARAA